jgi:hypothetical protein
VLKTLAVIVVVVALGGVSAEAAAPIPKPPNCDPYADAVVICVSHARPQPGRIFVGIYFWVRDPAATVVTALSCDAKVGGRIHWDGGAPNVGDKSFAGGVRLPPILPRDWSKSPFADGKRHVVRAMCGWRIPSWAGGRLLSLLHSPADLPCDPDCPAWGFHVEYGDSLREENQATWRVAKR